MVYNDIRYTNSFYGADDHLPHDEFVEERVIFPPLWGYDPWSQDPELAAFYEPTPGPGEEWIAGLIQALKTVAPVAVGVLGIWFLASQIKK